MTRIPFLFIVSLVAVLILGCGKKDEDTAKTTEDGEAASSSVQDAIKEATSATEDAIEEASEAAEESVEKASEAAEESVREASEATENAVEEGASAADEAASEARAASDRIAREIESLIDKVIQAIRDGDFDEAEASLKAAEAKKDDVPASLGKKIEDTRKSFDTAKAADDVRSALPRLGE